MSKVLIAALGCVLFIGIGCKAKGEVKDNDSTMSGTSTSTQTHTSGGADDCTHCAGTQTAKADGTCPACGAKVK
jgi:hypothetical protein